MSDDSSFCQLDTQTSHYSQDNPPTDTCTVQPSLDIQNPFSSDSLLCLIDN